MEKDIKIRLLKVGKKQVDLLEELRKRGYPKLYDTQLSKYLSGRDKSPQALAVIKIADEVVPQAVISSTNRG